MLVGFDKILDIVEEETGMQVGGLNVFVFLFLVCVLPLTIVDMFKIVARGTWLFRGILAVVSAVLVALSWPSYNGLLWMLMAFVLVMLGVDEWKKSGPGRGTRLWFRIRHLFFKGYVWENMELVELVLFKARYMPYMGDDEIKAIEEKIDGLRADGEF